MPQSPLYQELRQRIEVLEVENRRLAQVEAEYQTIFTMSLDMLCIADIESARFLKVNPAFVETLGYTERELLACTFIDFVHPEDVAATIEVIETSLKRGEKVFNFKNRYRCKNGAYRWLNWVSHPLPERGVTYAVAHDMTEEMRAQETIGHRQRFLESVLYHAPDAIVTLDAEHRVIDWNPGAVDMFGYRPEETIGMPLDDLVARQRSKEAGEKTRQVLSGKRVEAFETVRYRKDGTPLRVIAAGSPIKVEGVLRGVVAVYTDITARVRAETALRESEERFRTLVEKSPLGIALIGKDGRYRYINPEFRRMFGYTLEDVPSGTAWFRRAFPEKRHRDAAVRFWLSDLQNGVAGQYRSRVFTVTCKDGSRKEVLFRPVTMEDENQFVLCEDITDKKRMERQLQQVQKFEAIATLAGGVAHDFNNLLMGIQGRISLMATDLPAAHPHKEHIHAIDKHIRSAANLTRQLLGFARGGKYEVKPADISELLAGSAEMFGRTRKEIRIHLTTPPEPLVVEVDRQQIEQVLLNLFVNAWQAMPGGGDLFLSTSALALDAEYCAPHQVEPGTYARIAVTDTGIGMDEQTRLRIFDPFFTTKEKERGTGLGLASAYGIVKNHGGLISVYSEPGMGATFNVFLPLSDQDAHRDDHPQERLLGGRERVLLVDDEKMIVEVGLAMLEKLGYQALGAENGEQAVSTVGERGDEIDLVILDLVMPGLDGGNVFDRIRSLRPEMPVLLSSGYAMNGQAVDIMRRGCNGFIQKPFNIAELSQKLREVLDRPPKP